MTHVNDNKYLTFSVSLASVNDMIHPLLEKHNDKAMYVFKRRFHVVMGILQLSVDRVCNSFLLESRWSTSMARYMYSLEAIEDIISEVLPLIVREITSLTPNTLFANTIGISLVSERELIVTINEMDFLEAPSDE